MYTVIITSYNETKQGLVLRNNWIDVFTNDNQLTEYLEKFKIPLDFKYPSKNSVSDILIGEMELDNVCVHVRIVKF